MLVGLLVVAIVVVMLVAYSRPQAYRDLHPILVTLTWCAAAFFAGAYVGGDRVHADLMTMIPDDDQDLAAQLGAGIPFLEAMLVCSVALAFFFTLQLVLQVVESDED